MTKDFWDKESTQTALQKAKTAYNKTVKREKWHVLEKVFQEKTGIFMTAGTILTHIKEMRNGEHGNITSE